MSSALDQKRMSQQEEFYPNSENISQRDQPQPIQPELLNANRILLHQVPSNPETGTTTDLQTGVTSQRVFDIPQTVQELPVVPDVEASADTNQTVGAIICDYIDPELKKIQMLEEKNNQLISHQI